MRPPARRPTTIRSTTVIISMVMTMAVPTRSWADSARHDEKELVRAFLAGDAARSRESASREEQRAAALTEPYLTHPQFSLRREQSLGGTNEFSTTVAGLSVSLEISGRHGLSREAAGLDARAVGHRREAGRRAAVCDLRRLVQKVHARQSALMLHSVGQTRLEALAKDLGRLVKAGERAPYDLDRLGLQVEQHQQLLAGQRARLSAHLAELSALTGLEVLAVEVAPLSQSIRRGGAEVRPAVVSALETEARAEAARENAAGRRLIPDLGFYGAYRLDQAPGADAGHGYEAGLTVNLPFTDIGRVERGKAVARRLTLRAQASSIQARRRARLAALGARASALGKILNQSGLDRKRLGQAATRRYLTGVSPLSALIDTMNALEQAELLRLAQAAELRAITLDMSCMAGAFGEKKIEEMVKEVSP